MILLDTHVVIWLALDTDRLGKFARQIIAADDERRVSSMTWWEIAMNANKGSLAIAVPIADWIDAAVQNIDAREIAVTSRIALDAGNMPRALHGDPCDRILIATAQVLACPLITADEKILAYAADGHVKAIDARH